MANDRVDRDPVELHVRILLPKFTPGVPTIYFEKASRDSAVEILHEDICSVASEPDRSSPGDLLRSLLPKPRFRGDFPPNYPTPTLRANYGHSLSACDNVDDPLRHRLCSGPGWEFKDDADALHVRITPAGSAVGHDMNRFHA
jgi:hypothetical protein